MRRSLARSATFSEMLLGTAAAVRQADRSVVEFRQSRVFFSSSDRPPGVLPPPGAFPPPEVFPPPGGLPPPGLLLPPGLLPPPPSSFPPPAIAWTMSVAPFAILPATPDWTSVPMMTATSSRMPMYSAAVWPRSLRTVLQLMPLEVAIGGTAYTGPTVSTSRLDRSWDLFLDLPLCHAPEHAQGSRPSPARRDGRAGRVRWLIVRRGAPQAGARERQAAQERADRGGAADLLRRSARLGGRQARADHERAAAQQRRRQAPQPRLEDRVLRPGHQVQEPDR